MRIPLIALIGVFCGLNSLAQQEMILPLNGRPELYQLNEKHGEFRKSATPPDTLDLPFFDDFSDYFSRKFDQYYWPDTSRWIDRDAIVNDNLPRDPMSIGVVTLDGVDYLGQPYNWLAGNTGALADELTSVPLKLAGKSNVILSFYYQSGGNSTYGPEEEDILLLEFLDEDTVWNEVWQSPGLDDDSTFFLAMIPIDSTYFLYDGFQFRFRNYATQHSNGDFWHLDYIKLDDGRTMDDTVLNDIALLQRTSSLLQDYSAMPWTHFKLDPASNMGDRNYFRLRNSYDISKPANYSFAVIDSDLNEDFTSTESGTQVDPLTVCGNELNECNNDPFDNFLNSFSYTFSTGVEVSEDSAWFLVQSRLRETLDEVTANDTTSYIQEFYNYYAYDDGTAEVAFGLGHLVQPGEVVVKYDVKKTDTLQAVQVYFDPVKWNLAEDGFQLVVYSGDSIPETLLYESDTIFPEYTIQNIFYHYLIDSLIWGNPGNWFVGWRQFEDPDKIFTVGFDLQNDNSQNRFINLGQGWFSSSISGSLMLRPVFGKPLQSDPNSVQELKMIDLRPYPNPVEDFLNLGLNQGDIYASVDVIDMMGRTVLQRKTESRIDVSGLKPGMYMIRLSGTDGSVVGNARFIKQ